MRHSEAEDAGGLTPVKDDNEAAPPGRILRPHKTIASFYEELV